jgi:2-polyprenyl-3-methyl-5-hydroxy-6-metoxy-1,4-benzoquinol methylase
MTPVIAYELMKNYYSVINSEFYAEDIRNNMHKININKIEYNSYVNDIKSIIDAPSKVLEIGCGNGFLLKTLEERHYNCYGIEPSPYSYNHAKNILKLNVSNNFLPDSNFYNEKFDLVIMIDVIEHIYDANNFMKDIIKVLNPNGYVFIGTGNIKSLNAKIARSNWGYFKSWEHVSFFSPHSIHSLLESNGFTEININITSLQHKIIQNSFEFSKNIVKKIVNIFLTKKYYHGICYDHMIVLAKHQSG